MNYNLCSKRLNLNINSLNFTVSVNRHACHGCSSHSEARLTSEQGVIASSIASDRDQECGTRQCPWLIVVKPGQTIRLVLHDFAFGSKQHRYTSQLQHEPLLLKHSDVINIVYSCFRHLYNLPDPCRSYGSITEESVPHQTPICAGRQLLREVYHSVTHSIRVQLVSPEVIDKMGVFVLYYEGRWIC